MKKLFVVIFLLGLLPQTKAQFEDFYKGYFRSPLDIPSLLSANFGELRTDHFHAGIDFKTQGKIGYNIYACADGYISRIKISAAGYGKTLYITHPNGLMTVYAHLHNFNLQLEEYTREKQYANQKYEINIFPEPNEIPVSKGDIIGLSGNSGYSFGPHLHFEIRNVKDNSPLNPLFFDFGVIDEIPPKLFSLIVYPQNNSGIIEKSTQKKRFLVKKKNGSYQLAQGDTLVGYGPMGFAIEANDYFNNTHNRCGIYKSTLYLDGEKIFSQKIDKLSFTETRYINSHMDYAYNLDKRKKIHKSFIAPNNKLSIYEYISNDGIVNFNDTLVHELNYRIEDVHGNQSQLSFYVHANPEVKKEFKLPDFYKLLRYENENVIDTGQIRIEIPPYALYDSLLFQFSIDSSSDFLSPVYHVHNMYTPIHKYFSIAFELDSSLFNLPAEKLLVASFNKKQEAIAIGGQIENKKLTATTRYFGPYFIAIDTVKPKIIPEKFQANEDLSGQSYISFIVKDELSGIKSYNGYIDDQWVLFEYDYKNDRITYYFDEKMQNKKQHKIHIFIEDERGNVAEFESNFSWTKIG